MKKKTPTRVGLAALAVALLTGLAVLFFATHLRVEGRFYAKNAKTLDLRDQALTLESYEAVQQALPDCKIQWLVPVQGQRWALDTKEMTLRGLTEEDVRAMAYLTELETIDLTACPTSPLILQLLRDHEDAKLLYQVSIGGGTWPQDSQKLTLPSLTAEEIPLLAYLPELTQVDATACGDLALLSQLEQTYPQLRVAYQVPVGGKIWDRFSTELCAEGITAEELAQALPYMPELKTVSLTEPEGEGSAFRALSEEYSQISFQWSKTLLGVTVTREQEEVDLSAGEYDSLAQVQALMDWCPEARKLFLGTCDIDNEALSQFRESRRDDYKVVWNVKVGGLTLRTDDIYYMPGKFDQGITQDEIYNLRYCEDMICIDVGHKPLYTCEWAAFMPHLKYLVIADTSITDISPLTGLKELIYLEMFITQVKDYSPLLTCTALEDLNLCYSHGDPEPIKQMTWLKRLWWAESPIEVAQFQEYLPDTQLMFLHHSSTGNGWRQGQNYYDMRDIVGMNYMWG